jgi:hypothetical protein
MKPATCCRNAYCEPASRFLAHNLEPVSAYCALCGTAAAVLAQSFLVRRAGVFGRRGFYRVVGMNGPSLTASLISGGSFAVLCALIIHHGGGDEMGLLKAIFAIAAIAAAFSSGLFYDRHD